MRTGLILLGELICALCLGDLHSRRTEFALPTSDRPSATCRCSLRKETGIFARHKLDVEIVLLTSQLSAVALSSGELEYVAGVGPGRWRDSRGYSFPRCVGRLQSDVYTRSSRNRKLKTSLQDLRGKKIGVTGLGGTTHTSFMMAIEKVRRQSEGIYRRVRSDRSNICGP